jgi:hypothetical protein
LLVELIPARPSEANQKAINGKDVYAALKQSILNNFGDTGWGAVAFSLTGLLGSFAHTLAGSLTESFQSSIFRRQPILVSSEWPGIITAQHGLR